MEIYYAAGSPAGPLGDEQCYIYAGGAILELNEISYQIWYQFLGGNTKEKVSREENRLSFCTAEQTEDVIRELHETGLLISFTEIGEYVPLRLGTGVGCIGMPGDYLVYTDSLHHLDLLAYLIWLSCDGRRKFSRILEDFWASQQNVTEEEKNDAVRFLMQECLLVLNVED